MGVSSPRDDRDQKMSRNIQVSRPLLALCSRHVVILLMKVPQIAFFQQLA